MRECVLRALCQVDFCCRKTERTKTRKAVHVGCIASEMHAWCTNIMLIPWEKFFNIKYFRNLLLILVSCDVFDISYALKVVYRWQESNSINN